MQSIPHNAQLSAIEAFFDDCGAVSQHRRQIRKAWSQGYRLDAFAGKQHQRFSKTLQRALPRLDQQLDGLLSASEEHQGSDGAVRLLHRLSDRQLVESVLLPPEAVCISTQVGCAVGCVFCATGRNGLTRQLGSAEMVAQVAFAARRQRVRRVVFMGMGEPSHNLDNVIAAIDLLGTDGNIGHKNLVFSTVGGRRALDRLLANRVKPALAVSLHSTNPTLRARLLPRAPRIAPEELAQRAELYARTSGYPTQYEWTLMDGVNDGDEELRGLVSLLQGKKAMVNFIPLNRVEGTGYRRTNAQRAAEMVAFLRQHRIIATLRHSAAQDVAGGCGQLRARASGRQRPGASGTGATC